MSLSSAADRNDYTGNGSVSTYSYTYKIFLATDLVVTVADTSTPPVLTTLVKDTDYTVNGAGSSSGGTIALVNASQGWLTSGNLKTGYRLIIRRVRPLTQVTDIRNQGSFFPEIHEDSFDGFVMIDQQQQEQIDRSVKLPVNLLPSAFNPALPENITTPGVILGVNPSGNGFIAVPFINGTAIFGTPTQEVPSGTVNGVNGTFTLANAPISSPSVSLHLDGLILRQGTDYTISGSTITMTTAPSFGQSLYAVYQH